MRFIFAAQGTLGDVLPVLKLAREFHQNGHDVVFLTYSVFISFAEDYLPTNRCYGVCSEDQYQAMVGSSESWDPLACQDHHFQACGQYAIEPMYRIIQILSKGTPCTLVARKECLGAVWASESFALPYVRITLSPLDIRSKIRLPFEALKVSPAGNVEVQPDAVRDYWELVDARRSTLSLTLQNQYRQQFFLPPLTQHAELQPPESLCHIGFYNREFGNHDATCEKVELVGFALDEPKFSHSRLSIRDTNPLIYTPGSGVAGDQIQYEHFVKICRKINRPGVFVCNNVMFFNKPDDRVKVVKFVDMEPLLLSAAAIIHHGGIGTVADAIRAGIPQFILPRAFDQIDNACRVEYLKLGRRISFPQFFDTDYFAMQLQAELNQVRFLYNLKKATTPLVDCKNPFQLAMNTILTSLASRSDRYPVQKRDE